MYYGALLTSAMNEWNKEVFSHHPIFHLQSADCAMLVPYQARLFSSSSDVGQIGVSISVATDSRKTETQTFRGAGIFLLGVMSKRQY